MPIQIARTTGRRHPSVETVEFMTVGELIAILQKFDPGLPVGRAGHYGELWALRPSSVYEKTCMGIEYGLRWDDEGAIEAVTIDPPDIGPEPD